MKKILLLLAALVVMASCTSTLPKQFTALADKVERGGMYRDAPVLIVVCGDMDAALEGEGREFWVQDCSAATENLLLAVTAKGLGAVWTGVYPIQKRTQALQQALGLPQNIVPLDVVLIGYPKDTPKPKDKWKPENIHWEKW